MNLRNKWVLVTGASSGFGAATARAFGLHGSHVVMGARRLDRLQEVAREVVDAGAASVHVHILDVASTPSVESFTAWVRSVTPTVDILINNAGGAHGLDTIAHGSDGDWDAMIQSNFLGLLRMTRAILPLIPLETGGYILNIGSVAGHTAYEGASVYCGVKAAEKSITQSLRLELNGTGIRVGSLDPGLAETEFALVRFKGDSTRASNVYAGMIPLTAEDIADAIIWMVSRPPHVCIDELIIKPTDQAAIHKVHRRTP